MPWGYAAVAVGTIAAGKMSSDSQKDAAKKQAQSIKDAQGISGSAGAEARANALALFDPAFKDISTALNQARGDLLDGRVSSQDLLNDAFSRSSGTLQTSAQQSMNAILGNQPQLPSPEQSSLRDGAQLRPETGGYKPPRQDNISNIRDLATDGGMGPQPMQDGQSYQDVVDRGMGGVNPMQTNGSRLYSGLPQGQTVVDSAFNPSPPKQIDQSQFEGYQPTGPYNPDPVMEAGYQPVNPFPDGYDPMTGPQVINPDSGLTNVASNMQPLEGEFIPAGMNESNYNVQAPQGNYGLAGSESALRQSLGAQAGFLTGGAYDAMNSANQGFDQARNDVTGAFGTGMGLLRQGVKTGRSDITGQLDEGVSALRQGMNTGRGDIQSSSQSAINRFNPYVETGQSALDVEAARSGALGPEAQAQAFENYNSSPGQDWAREQMEKSTLRTQNAIGGTQGGNVLKALQRERDGLASQNYQRDLENLRSLASRGQQATGSQAGIETQAGRDMSSLAMRGGESELNARQNAGNQLAQMEYGAATTGAGMAERGGSALSNLASNRGLYNAGTQKDLSRDLSSAYGRTGENISNLRMNASEMIAQQLGLTGQQVAQLESQLGTSLANIDQQTITNMANQSAQQGGATSNLRTDLASLLTNLSTGNANNQTGMQMQLGNAQASGVTNPWGNTISQLTGMYANNPGMFSGNSSNPGGVQNDYTSSDYSNWVAGQG